MAIIIFDTHDFRDPDNMPKDLADYSYKGIYWVPRTLKIVFYDEAEKRFFKEWWYRSWLKGGTALGNLPCYYYTGKSHNQRPSNTINIGVLQKFNEFYKNAREFMIEYSK